MSASYKHVAIVYREETPRAQSLAFDLCSWLEEKKVQTYFFPEQKPQKPSCQGLDASTNLKKVDLMVVLGGDGTYLKALHFIQGHSIPLLGINMGSLGFLTENRASDLFAVMKEALEGQLISHELPLLQVTVKDSDGSEQELMALNDVVIERGKEPHLLNLSLQCDGRLVTETKADGLIISSPVGSTAYNLAAGGPILHPKVQATVVTAICPHSLTSRPLIFPHDKSLTFRLLGEERSAQLTLDGQAHTKIHSQQEISIKQHQVKHIALRKKSYHFFTLLREKLKFGERD